MGGLNPRYESYRISEENEHRLDFCPAYRSIGSWRLFVCKVAQANESHPSIRRFFATW